MHKKILVVFLAIFLTSCATTKYSVWTTSELQQGKRYFNEGFYKRAMRYLLPLACDGNPEAQYAVGYMYYYGYGVAQDTDVGYFWIERSAKQGFEPAQKAISTIDRSPPELHQSDKLINQ